MASRIHIGRQRARALKLAARLTTVRTPIRGPWAGFVPDINPNLLAPDAALDMKGLVAKGERLTTDDGWARLLGATNDDLPLGEDGDATGFNNGTDVLEFGTGLLEATNAGNDVIQPVIRLAAFPRISITAGVVNVDAMAITADTEQDIASPTRTESGHLFHTDLAGDWSSIEFRSEDGAGGGVEVTGDAPLSGTVDDLPDTAVYVPGVSTVSQGGFTAYEVAESVYVICNNVDSVYFYPDRTGSSNYSSYTSYADQLLNASTGAPPDVDPAITTFKAKSCESFFGRVVYLNTEEDGSRFAQRARWSVIGNPLIINPGMSVAGTNGVGAGFVDLNEFATEGLRVESLADVCACYFRDGVAFLRRLGIPTLAFSIQYVTRDRGLIGTHAMVNLGGGVHFGIFTDGWYLLDQAGRWREIGIVGREASSDLSGGGEPNITYKWKREFYTELNQNEAHKVYCGYDPFNKFIRISWPSGESTYNNEVWIYDLQNDRVFPDDYTAVGGNDLSAICWGNINRQTAAGVTWDDQPGTWDAQTQTWDETGSNFAETAPVHGTGYIDPNPVIDSAVAGSGLIFLHDPTAALRDGSNPDWSLRTHLHGYGSPFIIKTADRLWLEYENRETLISTASATIKSEQRDESHSFDLAKGVTGDTAVDHLDYRVPGHHHELTLAGAGCPDFRSMELQFIVEEPGGAPANRPIGDLGSMP